MVKKHFILVNTVGAANGITVKGINRLMGSNLPKMISPNLLFHNYLEAHSLIIINWLLESLRLRPKVIPLGGFHCN